MLVTNNSAFAEHKSFNFSIPAQPLNNALIQFATDSNIQLIFSADKVRNLQTKAISGKMTIENALKLLLKDTGLSYQYIKPGTITLISNSESKANKSTTAAEAFIAKPSTLKILKPLLILGNENGKTSFTHNHRYRVTNSQSSTKTDTPLLQTPQSIQLLPRALITDQQNLTIGESLKNVSGVISNHAIGTPSFESTLIRGFNAEQLLDGFTQYYNSGDRESLVNVERIEILKGSNALLYSGGAGAPAGGLINIISKVPESWAHYEVGMKYGSYQYYQPYFDLNQPINDHILFRITGEYTNSESHINTVNTERYNVNPALVLTNNDDTQLTLQGKISNWEQQDYQGLPATGTVSGDFRIQPNTYIGPSDIDPSSAEFYGVWGTLEHSINTDWSLTLKARYTQSEFDQKVQALFGADGFQADKPLLTPSTWALLNSELYQQQEEMSFSLNSTNKFSIGASDNTLLLGADYSEVSDKGFIDFNFFPIGFVDLNSAVFSEPYQNPGPGNNTIFVTNTTYGGYLQLQSTLHKRLHLLAGVRLGSITIDYKNTFPGFAFSSQSQEMKLLPRFGAVFDISNESSLFFNYSEGMRGQSFANFDDKPKPEHSRHIEAGIKFDIKDLLTGQFAAYQIDRSNILVTNNTGGLRSSSLSGKQQSRGIEADLVWQISDNFNMLMNYAYTDAHFKNAQSGFPAGTRLANVPDHAGRVWANYQFPQPELTGLSIGAGIYAQSAVYVSTANLFKTDSFYSVDSSIAYQINNYKFALSVKNLTDKRYFERIEYLGGSIAPAQGRSAFFNISAQF